MNEMVQAVYSFNHFGAEQNEYPLQQSEYKKRCVVIRREYGLQANNHLN